MFNLKLYEKSNPPIHPIHQRQSSKYILYLSLQQHDSYASACKVMWMPHVYKAKLTLQLGELINQMFHSDLNGGWRTLMCMLTSWDRPVAFFLQLFISRTFFCYSHFFSPLQCCYSLQLGRSLLLYLRKRKGEQRLSLCLCTFKWTVSMAMLHQEYYGFKVSLPNDIPHPVMQNTKPGALSDL